MEVTKERVLSAVDEAIVLQHFKTFCDRYSSAKDRQRLRNILYRSPSIENSVKNIFKNLDIELPADECRRMCELVTAFLRKSPYRSSVDDFERKVLLKKQNYKCGICGEPVDIRAHVDHIVPFKYVGDKLADNFQILCPQCNLSKNENMDYEVRYLIRHV